MSGRIYFIRAGDAGPIKVGFSVNVPRRLSTLQMGCPCPLVLLHDEAGTLDDERAWHDRLSEFKVRGEWFKPNHILRSYLKTKGKGLSVYIPLPYVRAERDFSGMGPLKKRMAEIEAKKAAMPRAMR